mmetsp:Transcript_5103/g.16221  ORF Transcript_5103/g.16221 Transcript_5103/m.16221 type:complete len:209 (+) Transcript_5103:779-1405(+)
MTKSLYLSEDVTRRTNAVTTATNNASKLNPKSQDVFATSWSWAGSTALRSIFLKALIRSCAPMRPTFMTSSRSNIEKASWSVMVPSISLRAARVCSLLRESSGLQCRRMILFLSSASAASLSLPSATSENHALASSALAASNSHLPHPSTSNTSARSPCPLAAFRAMPAITAGATPPPPSLISVGSNMPSCSGTVRAASQQKKPSSKT